MIVPVLLLTVGLAISVGSLSAELVTNYATSFSGSIAPGNLTLALPATPAGYLQVNLTEGSCNLRLYLADDAQWSLFNRSGVLPPAWLDCVDRGTTATGDVHNLILVNGGSGAGPYNVTVFAYSVATPYGWLAVPGAGLALAGLLLLVPRITMDRAMRMRDRSERKKEK